MPERLKAILDKITAWWKKFNTKQRSVLISIVAVVIVALVILGVVISRPTQVELVEAQSASEASTIKGVLEDNNISYEVDSKLVFFVNKSDLKKLQKDFWIMNLLLWMRKEQSHMFFQIFLTESNS